MSAPTPGLRILNVETYSQTRPANGSGYPGTPKGELFTDNAFVKNSEVPNAP